LDSTSTKIALQRKESKSTSSTNRKKILTLLPKKFKFELCHTHRVQLIYLLLSRWKPLLMLVRLSFCCPLFGLNIDKNEKIR